MATAPTVVLRAAQVHWLDAAKKSDADVSAQTASCRRVGWSLVGCVSRAHEHLASLHNPNPNSNPNPNHNPNHNPNRNHNPNPNPNRNTG